jgi:hypothetical protein
MEINRLNKNVNFNGIKLSNCRYEHVADVATRLNCGEFSFVEFKKSYVSNTFKDKHKALSFVREDTPFGSKLFGVVFLPWSKETYIISSPAEEQRLFPVIKKLDRKATLNLSL